MKSRHNGTVCAFAQELGEMEQASLLTETLKEEKETDEKLSKIAQQINTQANEGGAKEGKKEAAGNKKARRVA